MPVDVTEIVRIVIALIVAVVSGFVIPWIKSKVDQNTLNKVLTYVEIFVAAAEQLYDKSEGALKKQYVLEKLEQMGFKIDANILDSEIEAAVLRLHHELRGDTEVVVATEATKKRIVE